MCSRCSVLLRNRENIFPSHPPKNYCCLDSNIWCGNSVTAVKWDASDENFIKNLLFFAVRWTASLACFRCSAIQLKGSLWIVLRDKISENQENSLLNLIEIFNEIASSFQLWKWIIHEMKFINLKWRATNLFMTESRQFLQILMSWKQF